MGPALSMVVAEDLLRRGTAPALVDLAMPEAMVVMAHPDDETIALGARMDRFLRAHFVHVTDGAPRDEQDSRAQDRDDGSSAWLRSRGFGATLGRAPTRELARDPRPAT